MSTCKSSNFEKRLEAYGLTRRDFLKICGGLAAIMGVSQAAVPKIAGAIEKASKKPNVVWTLFSCDTGCTESFIKTNAPSTAKVVLDIINLEHHNTIMAAAGEQNIDLLNKAIKEGGFVWIAEGGVPTKPGYGQIADKEISDWANELNKSAAAVIAVGACATSGGIPAAKPNPSGVKSIKDATGNPNVINVSGCPANPDWLVSTVVYYLTFKKVPPLDSQNRPKFIYGQTIHDLCPRRAAFEAGNFVPYPGAPEEESKSFCLLKVGCKGPATFANCPVNLWNNRTNWCNGAGQCVGCAEQTFPDGMSPFYEELPGISIPGFGGTTATADKIGAAVGAAAVVGVGVHALSGLVKGPKGKAKVKE